MIVGTTSTMLLRSGVNVTRSSCALQPILLRGSTTTTCPYSTLPATSFSGLRSKFTSSALPSNQPAAAVAATTILAVRASQQATSPSSSRHASTSHSADARAAARAAATTTTTTTTTDPDTPPLDWNSFFQLRKSRRRWQLGFSALLSLASGAGGAVVLSTGAADSLTSQVPLDPVMTMGLMTIGFVALGWLAGPSLGSAVFYLLKRKYKVPMTVVSTYPVLA